MNTVTFKNENPSGVSYVIQWDNVTNVCTVRFLSDDGVEVAEPKHYGGGLAAGLCAVGHLIGQHKMKMYA